MKPKPKIQAGLTRSIEKLLNPSIHSSAVIVSTARMARAGSWRSMDMAFGADYEWIF